MFFLTTQAEDEEARQKNETYKLLASEQRAAVSQLYLDRNRPSLDNDVSNIFNYLKFSRKSLARLVHLEVIFGGKIELQQSKWRENDSLPVSCILPRCRKNTFLSIFFSFRSKKFVACSKILIFATFRQDPFVACAISKSFLDQWRQFLR